MNNVSLEIVLPVYNEEKELKENTLKLYDFLKNKFSGGQFKITIADNASNDRTSVIAKELSKKHKEINFVRLEKKGRGRAIKKVWLNSDASVLGYMDIDLSTNLESILPLHKAIIKDGYDLGIGSRLIKGAKIHNRPLIREILSRGLNLLIKIMFQTKFTDAQCGFKFISGKRKDLLSKIVDNEWFFDSELLITAEKSKLTIYEEPVIWVDNPGSTVRVMGTVSGDLQGLIRLFFIRPWNNSKINVL